MCPLLMMHKTCWINYGHLADLQKILPTTDLNKKKLSFDKISPRDFYFFPFFSICTCTWCTESYGLLMYTGPTRFYSNDIHIVKIKSNIRLRCLPWYLEMAKLYQLVPYKKCKFFIIILMVESNTDDNFFLLINVINGSWYQVKVYSH